MAANAAAAVADGSSSSSSVGSIGQPSEELVLFLRELRCLSEETLLVSSLVHGLPSDIRRCFV